RPLETAGRAEIGAIRHHPRKGVAVREIHAVLDREALWRRPGERDRDQPVRGGPQLPRAVPLDDLEAPLDQREAAGEVAHLVTAEVVGEEDLVAGGEVVVGPRPLARARDALLTRRDLRSDLGVRRRLPL